ncbi:hypothetical protein [Spiroplasma endosymbiont of Amphibalanus improvisus]|uniref:hypothetical protein n=1 Tax=Spiroplasma endosymbiont of Amphibalanus improvisus TaxID=3066327 RepID=UPI00313F1D63
MNREIPEIHLRKTALCFRVYEQIDKDWPISEENLFEQDYFHRLHYYICSQINWKNLNSKLINNYKNFL